MDVISKWILLCCLLVGSRVITQKATDIDTVHVIFMNHLDVGYNGISPQTGFINNILNKYFHEYFPRAAALAETLRKMKYDRGFIYTTHPWVASLYLDCPRDLVLSGIKLECPTQEEVATFERAVRLGDITWHAGPMNMQPENMNEMLFEMSLNISLDLDSRFGISRRFRTLSQRDVPGMSQAVLPTLVKKEVLAVSVGVNPDTAPPAVPRGLFLWEYGEFSAIAMWHPGGYPLNPGPSTRHPGGLSRDDCVTTNSLNHALCFAFRQDNSGPPVNTTEIIENYTILEAEFPGATIKASTFENFVEAILPNVNKLPVYSQEIGDTWMMGVASDPRKMAEYRTISNTLMSCVVAGDCDSRDALISGSVRFLIKPPEHTWGLPGVNDNVNWTNTDFQKAKSGAIFKNSSLAWAEQRRFNELAVEMLGNHSVVQDIKNNLADLTPQEPQPNKEEYVEIPYKPDNLFSCPSSGIKLSFGPGGQLTYLYDPVSQITWANGSNSLAEFLYRTYDEQDFSAMVTEYNYRPGNTFGSGIHKIGADKYAHPESKFWESQITGLYQRTATISDRCDFLVRIELVKAEAHTFYGAPDRIWLRYVVSGTPDPEVDITVQWFNKTATRLPEALFYSFRPQPQPGMSWRMSKIGQLIDPTRVGLNGSQNFHGIDDAIYYTSEDMGVGLKIRSRDVPLVCPFSLESPPTPIPVPLTPIRQVDGMAFNFYNNVWDTNYILWYPYLKGDENFKSRFSISFLRKDNKNADDEKSKCI